MQQVMKRIILLATIVLSTLASGWGQSGFYHVEGIPSKFSIVKEYLQNQAIAYSQDPTTSGFCLLDFGPMAATYAELPSGLVVNDFEILGNVVYFCGTYSGIPYLGHFKIAGLFGGVDDFYLHRLMISTSGHAIVNPEKLAVYSVGSEYHAVMVGAGRHLFPTGDVDERFVMDVYHDPNLPTQLTGLAVFNDSDPEYFYDIAATDNYVVSIAGKEDGNAHYMRAFDKPTVAGGSIFGSSTGDVYYYSQGDYFPVSKFLICPMSGDDFATVCYSENNSLFGAAISMFHAPLALQNRVILDQGTAATAGCDIKEMAFNPQNSTFSLLQSMVYPISANGASAICQLDAANNASANYITPQKFHSVCPWANDGSVLASGTNPAGLLSLFRHNPTARTCHTETPLRALHLSSQDGESKKRRSPQSVDSQFLTTAPSITTHRIIIDCQ